MLTGVSVTGIWKIENGRTVSPTGETIRKLASALEVTVSELVGEPEPVTVDQGRKTLREFAEILSRDDPQLPPQVAEAALEKFLQLSAEDRRYILGMVERLARGKVG